MKNYFFKTMAVAAVLIFVCTSCVKPAIEVTLDIVCITLAPNDFIVLTATVLPDNTANKNVMRTSDNTAVATVNNGTVTAKSAGIATITVTTEEGNATATCKVTVSNTPGK